MAEKVKFQPQKFDINSINGGNRYGLEGIQPEAVNAPIEAAAYAQALATNQPNIENAGLVGTPSVSIEEFDGTPRFKFQNLKGEKGIDGKDHSEEIAQLNEKLETYFISAKEQIDINSEEISKNSAKIHNLTGALLEGGVMDVVKVSQAFTTRQTADGENIIDEQNVFPKLIKGSTVKSANLINISEMLNDCLKDNGDGSFTFTKIAREPYRFTKQFFVNLPAGTYQLSCNVIESTTTARFRMHYINGNYGEKNYDLGATQTVTFSKQVDFVELFLSSTATDGQYVIFKEFMLNEGSTALPFRPYFSGLKNAHLQSIKSTGRNLIPYPYAFSGSVTKKGITFTDNGDGSVTVNGTATAAAYVYFVRDSNLSISAGQYTVSGNSGGVTVNARKNNSAWIDNGQTGAFNDGDAFDMIGLYVSSGVTINNVTVYPMFNHGTTALPFEPYTEDTFNLPETLELGEYDSYNPKTGYVARYTEYATSETGFTEDQLFMVDGAILSADGKTLAYKKMSFKGEQYTKRDTHYTAWNGGTETQVQGETDNSADGAMCTLTNDYFVKVGGATNEQTE